jgi:hypothetical protein
MSNGTPTTTVKVENLIITLKNIEKWCAAVAQALEAHGRDQAIAVPPEVHEMILGKPPQAAGECSKVTTNT